MSPEVTEACRDSPQVLSWQRENCCEAIEGEKVPCARVVFENLRVSAREGRRHWVFEPSIPPVRFEDRSMFLLGGSASTHQRMFFRAMHLGQKAVAVDIRSFGGGGATTVRDRARCCSSFCFPREIFIDLSGTGYARGFSFVFVPVEACMVKFTAFVASCVEWSRGWTLQHTTNREKHPRGPFTTLFRGFNRNIVRQRPVHDATCVA